MVLPEATSTATIIERRRAGRQTGAPAASRSRRRDLGEPPATKLPPNPEAEKLLAEGKPAVEVAAAYPAFSLAWALLEGRYLEGSVVVVKVEDDKIVLA